MQFFNINLERRLQSIERNESSNKKELLTEVHEILAQGFDDDRRVIQSIRENSKEKSELNLFSDVPVYSLKSIYKLCVRYRLRFLDSKYFKGEIPYEAIQKVKDFERTNAVKVGSYKILAPVELFSTEDKDSDPLLFIDLGNNNYYLVHKWGRDMSFLRYLMVFPLRNYYTLFFTITAAVALFSFSIPVEKFIYSLFIFMFTFIASCCLTLLYCFAYRKNLNQIGWNSKFK